MVVAHAFVDESARGADYYVCAAVTVDRNVKDLRKLARDFCKQGQRTVHFVNERPARRGQFLTAITSSGLVRARIAYGKGDATAVRDAAIRALAQDLASANTRRLIIESRQGRDHLDRKAIAETLQGLNQSDLVYEHLAAPSDPGLWVADAVAWSYSAGGRWRERLEPIVDFEYNVGRL